MNNENILTFQENPNTKTPLVISAMLLVVLCPFAYSLGDQGWWVILFILGFTAYWVFTTRTFLCVMDKNTARISYKRGGVFNSKIDEQSYEFPFSEVTHVEVKRFISRGGDFFQCRIVVKNGQSFNILASNKSLQDTQMLAQKIQTFLALESPVQFVD